MKPTPQDIVIQTTLDLIRDRFAKMPATIENVRAAIVAVEYALIGVAEIGKSNCGYWVDIFQKSIGMHGAPWCLAMQQYVFKYVASFWLFPDLLPFDTASTQALWRWADQQDLTVSTFDALYSCDLVIWRDGSRDLGHVGCAVTDPNYEQRNTITLIEGNTSTADWRDGGHVAEKVYTEGELNMGISRPDKRWCRGAIRFDKLYDMALHGATPTA